MPLRLPRDDGPLDDEVGGGDDQRMTDLSEPAAMRRRQRKKRPLLVSPLMPVDSVASKEGCSDDEKKLCISPFATTAAVSTRR